MTYKKESIVVLAYATAKWAAESGYIKDGDEPHSYFTEEDWCAYFQSTGYILRKVKLEMLSRSIPILWRPRYGHYISDDYTDIAFSADNYLKNILTRVETLSSVFDCVRKTQYSKETFERIQEAINDLSDRFDTVSFDDSGYLTISPKAHMLPATIE